MVHLDNSFKDHKYKDQIIIIQEIIDSLEVIKSKFINYEPVTNEDWIIPASKLRGNINKFLNLNN